MEKSKKEIKVSIIICAYNNLKIIDLCLKSIKNQTYKNYECLLIDDASPDKTGDYVKKKFPWVNVIINKTNLGPSIGRNKGISASKGEYIATLDSDIELDKNWLKKQITFIEKHKDLGIVGSNLLYSSNRKKTNSIGGGLTRTGIGFDITKLSNSSKSSNISYTSKIKSKKDNILMDFKFIYVCSAAMLMKRGMVNQIGSFDETYFYGHEDTDLGWRANIAGYKVYTNLDAIAYHRISETMKKRPKTLYYYSTKNRIRSIIKNYELHNLIIYLPILGIIMLGDIIFRSNRLEKIKAIFWNISHLSKTLNKRKIVQKTRLVKDKELFKLIQNRLW